MRFSINVKEVGMPDCRTVSINPSDLLEVRSWMLNSINVKEIGMPDCRTVSINPSDLLEVVDAELYKYFSSASEPDPVLGQPQTNTDPLLVRVFSGVGSQVWS
ncbi:hypothetical protein J6590_029213 [Homalodisca vitripennis]|nr:hypothetical protein J6590_029213 [Homalodisca vitripennis]